MFTNDLIRYMKGTVKFCAYGAEFERFLNRALEEHIPIWNVGKNDGRYCAVTTVKGYKRLAKVARKNKIRLHTDRRKGFPFLAYRYRRRPGIVIGLGIFFGFLIIMQNFVWQIDVSGNVSIPTAQVIALAKELGLHQGAFTRRLDFKTIQKELEFRLPDVAWLTVNHMGSKVVIELKESKKAPDLIDENSPCNLVAKKDGVIKYMEVYSGQKMVKVKDVVGKGDLLVSGILEDQFQQTTFCTARGTIIAETYETKEFSQPLETEEKIYTGTVKKRNYLDLFGFKLPLFIAYHLDGQFENIQEYQQFRLLGKELPLGLHKLELKEYRTEKRSYQPEEAEQILLKQIEKYETTECKDAKIISKEVDKSENNGAYVIKISYVFEEDIAQKEEIIINE